MKTFLSSRSRPYRGLPRPVLYGLPALLPVLLGAEPVAGGRVVASPGGSIGGRHAFVIFPEQRMVISVMSNVTGAEVRPVWQALLRLFTPSGS